MSFSCPDNIHFKCLPRCGICCGDTRARTRHILLLENEGQRISRLVGKPIPEFAEIVNDRHPYTYEMKKTKSEGKCVFLKSTKCTIYRARPLICRFYPFHLGAEESGSYAFHATQECPGIGGGTRLERKHFEKLFSQASQRLHTRN